MTEKPVPVEVFGVRSDGELIPLTSGSSRPAEADEPHDGRQTGIESERTWILGPIESGVGTGENLDDDHPGSPGYQARKAPRPGGYRDRPTRAGGREDVVAPVPVLPGRASRALHTGELFVDPLPGLTVSTDSLEVGTHGSSWDATVTWGRLRRRTRPATLRAYPSRSANLTVLELVPMRSRLFHTRSFIRVGVPAIATLGSRINRAAGLRPSTSVHPGPSVPAPAATDVR